MPIPQITPVANEADYSKYDALVLVAPASAVKEGPFSDAFGEVAKVDKKFGSEVLFLSHKQASGGRLVWSPICTFDKDTDDVRVIADATKKGILRAKASGATKPLLLIKGIPIDNYPEYSHAAHVALLAVLEGLYERLQARESLGENEIEVTQEVGFAVPHGITAEEAHNIVTVVRGIEEGRRLARDIGGADPERMTPLRSAEYIKQAFAHHSNVKVTVVDSDEKLRAEYPLLHAVARASTVVARHRPAVVHLEYVPESYEETVLISGKGVTYDTGGADVKFGGHMAGMSRDKCGAAAAAGFVLTAAVLKPAVRIITELGFVRNSIGSEAYVADEIITSHAGARVLVGNTDAEGRMVLSDCLSHLRAQAVQEKIANARFHTIATLTGHVVRAYGSYTAVVDNGPAKQLGLSESIQKAGHLWADPIEVSTLRREDYNMVASKNNAYDLLQCNNAASSMTSRGHQFPAAFILKASGLDQHSRNSATPLAFTHIDIAGSAIEDDYQFGKPTATPVVTLTARYLLHKLSFAVKGLSTKI